MRIYQPIEGLLNRRPKRRRHRVTFGIFGIVGLGLVIYWALFGYPDRPAEARTDRIISLSAPDFTDVLSAPGDDAAVETGAERIRSVPEQISGQIEPSQTVSAALVDAGVESASLRSVVLAFDGVFDFRRSRPGDEWEARLDSEARIRTFRYAVSREEVYEALRRPDGDYEARRLDIPTQTVLASLGGTVLTSVYDAVEAQGEGTALASRFMEVFAWDIDFSRDARPGDRFRMLVEKVLLDGELLRYGRVLAADYQGRNAELRAFAHTNSEGQTRYYTAEGEALYRDFLQAPLNYRRISSTFTRRRFHPVLRRYRPHLGVDYAADTGTPVWSVAEGRVTYAGFRGANGNLVVIEHADGYESIYAHLSRFADGVRRGREVRQGQVIGYVGTTGRSTGPHLHLGIRLDGEHIDPMSIQATRGPSLRGRDLESFRANAARYQGALEVIELAPVDLSTLTLDEPLEDRDDLPNDFGVLEGDDLHEDEDE